MFGSRETHRGLPLWISRTLVMPTTPSVTWTERICWGSGCACNSLAAVFEKVGRMTGIATTTDAAVSTETVAATLLLLVRQ
ncbi:hypothetical protein DYB32_006995 [Aphanomyces invadans]|uniref:Uncharacterized protein n=1 Tax=Aphanomyces invadans TaxID=157072 RepID=A0A3R6YVT5_9STRA|nr:hypothetical protein DYB32_006995 [Aphanomyces invadans]